MAIGNWGDAFAMLGDAGAGAGAGLGTAAAPGWLDKILKVAGDPNIWNLLMGMGAQLDPTGPGGIIGIPGMNVNRAMQYQNAVGKSQGAWDEFLKALSGQGVTPKGQAGITKAEMDKDGSVKLELNPKDSDTLNMGPVGAAPGTSAPGTAAPSSPGNFLQSLLTNPGNF